MVAGGALLANPDLRAQAVHMFELTGQNAARVAIYQANLDIIREHPVLGLGFGRYRTAARPYYDARPAADRRSHAHSNYLQLAAEAGLLGLAAFMWVFMRALTVGWTAVRAASDADGRVVVGRGVGGDGGLPRRRCDAVHLRRQRGGARDVVHARAADAARARRMKVLHVDPERGWGGGERQVQLLLRELAQRGHEQTLAADPDGRLARVLPAGVGFAPLRIANHADVLAGVRLRTLARGHDVVHFHTARAHALAPLCPRSLWRVVTRRMDYVPRGGPYVRWLYNHGVDAVIAISDGVRRALLAGGVRAERIHVVASGIDPDALVAPVDARAACRSAWGVGDEVFVAVVLGALERRKGQDVLLEAARAVPTIARRALRRRLGAREPRARRVVGSGGAVTFAGFRQDVAACLAAADVVVLPSRHEGLGVAALEAMAAERPVVASRVGGSPRSSSRGRPACRAAGRRAASRGGARAPGRRSRRARRLGTCRSRTGAGAIHRRDHGGGHARLLREDVVTPVGARRLATLVRRFRGVRVLVVGDLMLDTFIWGRVDRISPEAPVPVVRVTADDTRAGGAGNVVGNVAALGGRAAACGVVGRDAAGREVDPCARGASVRAPRA